MTSPVVAARTASLINADNSLQTVTLGSPSAGDLLIAITSIDSPTVFFLDKGYSGSLWNAVQQNNNNGNGAVVSWKVAEGGGVDQLRYFMNGTSEQSSSIVFRVTGHGGAVFIASSSSAFGTPSANADPPNCAITGSGQDLLAIAAACNDATVVASAAPAGYGTLTTQAGGANGASVSVADKALTAATSENPGTFTTASEDWAGFTILVTSTAITTNARETQEIIEAVSLVDPNMRATQVAVEAVSVNVNNMRASQVVVETVSTRTLAMFVTQVVVETVSADPVAASDVAIVGAFI